MFGVAYKWRCAAKDQSKFVQCVVAKVVAAKDQSKSVQCAVAKVACCQGPIKICAHTAPYKGTGPAILSATTPTH